MSNFTGMDIPAVRNLATQLQNKANEIDSMRQQLTAQLEGTSWIGPDATRFRGDWTGQHVSSLNQVSQALRDAAQRAIQNANEQESAASA